MESTFPINNALDASFQTGNKITNQFRTESKPDLEHWLENAFNSPGTSPEKGKLDIKRSKCEVCGKWIRHDMKLHMLLHAGEVAKSEDWKNDKRKILAQAVKGFIARKVYIKQPTNVQDKDCQRCPRKCTKFISTADQKVLREEFWNLNDYHLQNQYIVNSILEVPLATNTRRKMSRLYFLTVNQDIIQVCQGFFRATLNVSEKRIRIAIKNKTKDRMIVYPDDIGNKLLFGKDIVLKVKCKICLKMYDSRLALAGHMKKHRNGKSYVCPICGLTFVRISAIVKHRAKHISTKKQDEQKDKNSSECKVCGKTIKYDMKIHMHLHASKPTYKCSICGVAFTEIVELTHHFRTHTGEQRAEKQCNDRRGRMKQPSNVQDKDCGRCPRKCTQSLSTADQQVLREAFWNLDDYQQQNQHIVNSILEVPLATNTRRKMSRLYFLTVNQDTIQVCQGFFRATFKITEKRIRIALQNKTEDNIAAGNGRGRVVRKRQPSDNRKREGIRSHIQSYLEEQSHNGLTVSHMYRCYIQYCEKNDFPNAKMWQYRHIFNTEFRVEIDTPKSDSPLPAM